MEAGEAFVAQLTLFQIMWYVIQTQTGKEELVRQLICNMLPAESFEDCRILYYEAERKYRGIWRMEQRRVFPGYLFLITEQIGEAQSYLRRIPEMTRLLGSENLAMPITEAEADVLQQLCGEDGNAAMSSGIQIGDQILVKQGCLKGMESRIRRIDRHKRRAWIELELLGEQRLVEVGLEIVEKRPSSEKH